MGVCHPHLHGGDVDGDGDGGGDGDGDGGGDLVPYGEGWWAELIQTTQRTPTELLREEVREMREDIAGLRRQVQLLSAPAAHDEVREMRKEIVGLRRQVQFLSVPAAHVVTTSTTTVQTPSPTYKPRLTDCGKLYPNFRILAPSQMSKNHQKTKHSHIHTQDLVDNFLVIF